MTDTNEPSPPTDRSSSGSPSACWPEVLTTEEVASLLRVNVKTVYDAVRADEVPGVRRIGRVIRFSRDAVLRWLHDGQPRGPRSKRYR